MTSPDRGFWDQSYPPSVLHPTPPGPDPARAAWDAAYAARGSAPARILAVGDSVIEGQGSSTRTGRWINRMASTLRGSAVGTEYLAPFYLTYEPDSPWAGWAGASSGTITSDVWAATLGWRHISMGDGATRQYTVTGTAIDLWWVSGGGTLTYTVDAGEPVEIDTSGAFGIHRTTGIPLGAAGAHTIALSAEGDCYVGGFTVVNGDAAAGLHLFDGGHTGAKVSDLVADLPNQASTFAQVAPALVIVAVGLNDCGDSVPAGDFADDLVALVDQAKAIPSGPSVLVLANYEPAPSTVGTVPWADYVAAMAGVAESAEVAFHSLADAMPPADTSGTGFYRADGLHPNDSGHTEIAALVSAWATGGGS